MTHHTRSGNAPGNADAVGTRVTGAPLDRVDEGAGAER